MIYFLCKINNKYFRCCTNFRPLIKEINLWYWSCVSLYRLSHMLGNMIIRFYTILWSSCSSSAVVIDAKPNVKTSLYSMMSWWCHGGCWEALLFQEVLMWFTIDEIITRSCTLILVLLIVGIQTPYASLFIIHKLFIDCACSTEPRSLSLSVFK